MKQLPGVSVVFILLVLITACDSDPDLQLIRSGINSMSVAAENHDVDGISRYIDDDYRGVGATRQGVTNLLERHFSYNENINLIISDIEIKIAEDRQTARTSLRVLMTGGKGNLPERGRLSVIKSTWKKRGEEWKVIRADWKPVILSI